jgi:putative hydrolase of the HAD superfamily
MSSLKLVFDLDDTLYPERMFAISGFRAAAAWAERELGLTGLHEPMLRLLDAGHLRQLFHIVLAEHAPGHRPDQLEAFIDAYRTHAPEIELFEDAHAALEHFGAREPIGLITDGLHHVQAAKVRALGLEPRLGHIIYTDALGGRAFSKPNPKAFELMQAALGTPGDRFVYVGDNSAKDFVAPNALGWITVQVVRPGGIHDGSKIAEGGRPQHSISTLDELPALLG